MSLRMVYVTKRDDSSRHQFRMRTPAGVLERARGRKLLISLPAVNGQKPVTITTQIGAEIKFSLRTRDHTVATIWKATAQAEIERMFASLERVQVLSHRELVALSGSVYRIWIEAYSDNPGMADDWAVFKALSRAALEGRILEAPSLVHTQRPQEVNVFGSDLTGGVNALPVSESVEALEQRFGALADWVLMREGFMIDNDTRRRLLTEIAKASIDAGWQLKRNANSDYRPDPLAERFPSIEKRTAGTLSGIFDRWIEEVTPAASTIATWTTVINRMIDVIGDDVARIGPDEIVSFKDSLLKRGLSTKTINDSYLAAANAIFSFAVRNRIIRANPAIGIKVTVRKRAGERQLPYTDEEVGRLLALAAGEQHTGRRWLPWLAATTGARIGELAQLWGARVISQDGIWVMHLAPAEDGGSIKNEGSERLVPLHPAVLKAGFLQFVEQNGSGPLFYKRSRSTGRHASVGVRNHLAAWIRENGFNDPRKAPNHALRHWFKSAAVKAGISDSIADAIQGHATAGEASRYRHFDLPTLAAAVRLIKV